MVQGIAVPALTLSYTGLIRGEAASVLTTQGSANTTATIGSLPGSYPIVISGATASNYVITFQNGTLTVIQGTPTRMGTFSAVINGRSVQLNWTTLSEYKNDYFTVERSQNGKKFEEVVRVKGSFYSEFGEKYTSYDNDPYNGNIYYRIKQTNLDGTFTYSKVDEVSFAGHKNFKFSIYPNPVTNEIRLVFDGKLSNLQTFDLIVMNASGRGVLRGKGSLNSLNDLLSSNLGSLAPGIYVVVLNNSASVSTAKFIKL